LAQLAATQIASSIFFNGSSKAHLLLNRLGIIAIAEVGWYLQTFRQGKSLCEGRFGQQDDKPPNISNDAPFGQAAHSV